MALTIPTRGDVAGQTPTLGMDPLAVGGSALLPALGYGVGMATGHPAVGQLLSVIGSIPGQVMDYAAQQEAATIANQDRDRALGLIERAMAPGSGMYIPKPVEFSKMGDPLIEAIPQANAIRKAAAQRTKLRSQDLRSRLAGEGVSLAPEAESDLFSDIEWEERGQAGASIKELFQQARRDRNNQLFAIGQAETSRREANVGTQRSLTMAAATILGTPLDSVSAQGVFDTVNQGLQFLEQSRLQREQIAAQRHAANQSLMGSITGSGISAAGSVASGALIASAL